MSVIKDPSLAGVGLQKIAWVKSNMPILSGLEQEFLRTRPFAGLRLTVSVHLEAKTAYLVTMLAAGGARVAATGSNPLSTQDDVAAGLATYANVDVYARHNPGPAEYLEHLEAALAFGPHIVIDDGGDLIHMLHTKRRDLLTGLLGGCE
ncbi:MAG: adenosylhomocysteinase, partial [Clostridiales bacterium]|nr:adenosylhomocysteinase [Clostridiales bacterium]